MVFLGCLELADATAGWCHVNSAGWDVTSASWDFAGGITTMLMQIQQQFTIPQALVKCLSRFHSNCNSNNPENYWASQPENRRNVFLPYIFVVWVLTFIVKGEKKMTGHSWVQVDCQTRRQLLSGYVSNFLDRILGARRELTVLSFGGEETIILIY